MPAPSHRSTLSRDRGTRLWTCGRRGRLAPAALLRAAVLLAALLPPAAALPPPGIAALVQLGGPVPSGGTVRGGARLPLERASGGDTPVLSFRVVEDPAGSPPRILRLLLDTGASATMVTPAAVRRLGLRSVPLPPGAAAMAGGGETCDRLAPAHTLLPPLEIRSPEADRSGQPTQGLQLDGAEALVLPVAGLPEGIDGVLGVPTLRRLAVKIDPAAGQVLLGGGAATAAPGPSGRRPLRIPLRWHRGVPLLRISGAAGPLEALADSGAEGLFLAPSLALRLQPLDRPRDLRLVGVCGEQRVTQRRFAGLTLPGRARAVAVTGIVIDNPIFAALGIEVIAGQEWLRQHRQLWRLDQEPPFLLLW